MEYVTYNNCILLVYLLITFFSPHLIGRFGGTKIFEYLMTRFSKDRLSSWAFFFTFDSWKKLIGIFKPGSYLELIKANTSLLKNEKLLDNMDSTCFKMAQKSRTLGIK